MKPIFLLTLICTTLLTCKDQNSDHQIKSKETPQVREEPLKVVINAVVPLADIFEVYYYEPGLETFDSNEYVETKVVGSNEAQDIVFTLPEDMFPERLRLDFGKLHTQKKIQLNSIKLIFGSKQFEFSREQIINEMKHSKFIDFNTETFEIETMEIDNRYDPYFYTPKLNNIVNYLLED